jgi:hypothetical protein
MISEIWPHSFHEAHRPEGDTHGRRDLPLVCPHCQQSITLAVGLCGNRQIDAILLQAERIGAELECQSCGLRFVFHRTGSALGQRSRVISSSGTFGVSGVHR